MMRFPRWAYVSTVLLVALTWMMTGAVYARLPDPMAVHWGPAGAADGFAPRIWGAWFGPALLTALAVLLLGLVPLLEPWQHNLRRFRGAYAGVALGLLLFIALVQGWVLAWNLGWRGDVRRFLALLFVFLNAGVAWALPRARPNWFFGIRTPWTLSSPRVWHETHRAGAVVFGLAAVLSLVAVVWPSALLAMVAWLLLGNVGLTVYAALRYRRLARETAV